MDDRNLSQKHVNLYQPVMFNTPDSPQPVEVVINDIGKDHIHGYASAPKYPSRNWPRCRMQRRMMLLTRLKERRTRMNNLRRERSFHCQNRRVCSTWELRLPRYGVSILFEIGINLQLTIRRFSLPDPESQ